MSNTSNALLMAGVLIVALVMDVFASAALSWWAGRRYGIDEKMDHIFRTVWMLSLVAAPVLGWLAVCGLYIALVELAR